MKQQRKAAETGKSGERQRKAADATSTGGRKGKQLKAAKGSKDLGGRTGTGQSFFLANPYTHESHEPKRDTIIQHLIILDIMVERAVCKPSLSIYIKLAVEGANGTDFPEPARRRQEHENDKHTKLITTTPKGWGA